VSFEKGSTVTVKAFFRDFSNQPTDPDEAPTLTATAPSSKQTVKAMAKESTGTYYTRLIVDEEGRWLLKVEAYVAGYPLVARKAIKVVESR